MVITAGSVTSPSNVPGETQVSMMIVSCTPTQAPGSVGYNRARLLVSSALSSRRQDRVFVSLVPAMMRLRPVGELNWSYQHPIRFGSYSEAAPLPFTVDH